MADMGGGVASKMPVPRYQRIKRPASRWSPSAAVGNARTAGPWGEGVGSAKAPRAARGPRRAQGRRREPSTTAHPGRGRALDPPAKAPALRVRFPRARVSGNYLDAGRTLIERGTGMPTAGPSMLAWIVDAACRTGRASDMINFPASIRFHQRAQSPMLLSRLPRGAHHANLPRAYKGFERGTRGPGGFCPARAPQQQSFDRAKAARPEDDHDAGQSWLLEPSAVSDCASGRARRG
jgi:hypothetical protein